MPILFILAVIVLLVGLGAFVSARSIRREEDKRFTKFIGGIATGLGLLLLLMACTTMVSTRNIGVLTSFGKPVDSLSNGLHFKPPWMKVSELDGAIQTDTYSGDHCINVRLGSEGTGCVDVSVQWQIAQEAGDELFLNYRTEDKIRESLVTRKLKSSLNDTLGDFNPLDAVKTSNEDDSADGTEVGDLDAFGEQVTTRLQDEVGDQIAGINVLIPLIKYDEKTQARLNEYQEEFANTRIAEQRKETASAQAAANRELAASVSKDPNVLVARCFDLIESGKLTLPPGGSCWYGANGSVVIPSAAQPAPQ